MFLYDIYTQAPKPWHSSPSTHALAKENVLKLLVTTSVKIVCWRDEVNYHSHEAVLYKCSIIITKSVFLACQSERRVGSY